MRRAVLFSAASILVLSLSNCASVTDNATASLIKPDLAIEQVGATTFGGRDSNMSPNVGPAPVNFRVLVRNNSSETIRLTRLELSSVGRGAYTVSNVSRPFDVELPPEEVKEVQVWAPTVVQNTIAGAQGPVTLRVTAYFDSPVGQFREIYTRNINDPLRPGPAAQ